MALTKKQISENYRNKHREKIRENARRNAAERYKDPEERRKMIEAVKRSYIKYRSQRLIQGKQRSKTIKIEVMTYYSKGVPMCECCEIKDIEFLSIDHVNNDGAEHRRKTGIKGGEDMYRWLRRNDYPLGFRVLCMNCQLATRLGICPHQKGKSL